MSENINRSDKMQTDSAAIEARDVSKYYLSGKERFAAISHIDLRIQKGEFISVMGPSGSGKTTLLNCLSGLDRISEGTVLVNGSNIAEMSDSAISRFRARNMGFVFQNYALLPVFTTVENVELPALIMGEKASRARELAVNTLELVGMANRASFKPSQLSGGEQQRAAIARALVNSPEVIWADEPTGNLDTEAGRVIMELFSKLNSALGATVVVVTHDERVASYTGRRISIMDGKIVDGSGVVTG